MTTKQNLDEYEMVNGKWVKKSTSDSRPLPDPDIQIGEPRYDTPDLDINIDSPVLGGSSSTEVTSSGNPVSSSLGLGTSSVYDDITSGGSGASDLGGGGLAGALSGYQTKFADVFAGEGREGAAAPVMTTWKKRDLTGLSGMDIQQDVNQKMAEASEGMSSTLLKENYAGAGKSFDAGAARQMATQMGAAAAQRQAAGVTARFGHEMQNYKENLAGRSQMADEANKLQAWLINRGQTDRNLQFGLQNINASMYAQQLATQMALAGIPLDMISSLLGGMGGLGGGNLLGNIMDPITQALQG
jgi:hypothetical protein